MRAITGSLLTILIGAGCSRTHDEASQPRNVAIEIGAVDVAAIDVHDDVDDVAAEPTPDDASSTFGFDGPFARFEDWCVKTLNTTCVVKGRVLGPSGAAFAEAAVLQTWGIPNTHDRAEDQVRVAVRVGAQWFISKEGVDASKNYGFGGMRWDERARFEKLAFVDVISGGPPELLVRLRVELTECGGCWGPMAEKVKFSSTKIGDSTVTMVCGAASSGTPFCTMFPAPTSLYTTEHSDSPSIWTTTLAGDVVTLTRRTPLGTDAPITRTVRLP
jgi:hypothetical protein